MVASCSSSVAIPSVITNPPNAHSKSPITLLTINVALAGSSNTVAGTLFGAFTSRRREVLQATSRKAVALNAAADRTARRPNLVECLDVICVMILNRRWSGQVSVRDPDVEQERRELGILGLVERVAAVRAAQIVLGVDPGVAGPRVQIAAARRERQRLRADQSRNAIRGVVRHRDFSKLREARRLDEEIPQRTRVLYLRDDRRIVLVREHRVNA